jgi:hypothetical protein
MNLLIGRPPKRERLSGNISESGPEILENSTESVNPPMHFSEKMDNLKMLE